MTIVEWTPPEWECNRFPQTQPSQEIAVVDELVAVLHSHIDTATKADTTPLCAVLHVAHKFMTLQGADGRWPALLNLRTGEILNSGLTASPAGVLSRLDALLNASEFDQVCARAEARG